MASLQSRLSDFILAVGTDVKLLRTYISGSSTGDLTGLTTTAKTSLVAAINEVKASATGSPPSATTTVAGVIRIATQTEVNTGTDNTIGVTPLTFQTRLAAYAQQLNANLTTLAGITPGATGQALLAAATAAAAKTTLGLAAIASSGSASDLTTGTVPAAQLPIATQTVVNTGTDDITVVTPLKFQTRLAAYAQPLNTNLTNLAGVTNTAYGRALLALADGIALAAQVAAASQTQVGVHRFATQTEVNTGTATGTGIEPLTFQTRLAAYAMPLTYLDTDVTLAANSNTKVASQAAVKAYADGRIAAADAFVAKGVIDCSTNPNYPAANAGDTYRVSVAGKIGGASGPNVEVGDMIMCFVDASAAGTQAVVGANWDIIQVNIDGAVVGPASSTTGDLATFSGTTGKVVADSGFAPSNGAIGAGSAILLPTSAAVVAYLTANYYTQTQLGNPDTDLATAYNTAKT